MIQSLNLDRGDIEDAVKIKTDLYIQGTLDTDVVAIISGDSIVKIALELIPPITVNLEHAPIMYCDIERNFRHYK